MGENTYIGIPNLLTDNWTKRSRRGIEGESVGRQRTTLQSNVTVGKLVSIGTGATIGTGSSLDDMVAIGNSLLHLFPFFYIFYKECLNFWLIYVFFLLLVFVLRVQHGYW